MPRPSSNPDKAYSGGGGIPNGNYKITAAKYQNLKTEYRPNQPYLVLGCAVLDKDGDVVRGADDIELNLSLGEKALDAFHPGECEGPEDDNPKDQGDEPDAEGNTLYCDDPGSQLNRSSGYMVFNETLVKAGYSKATLDQSYAPNYEGIEFTLENLDAKTANEKFGLRLNTKPFKDKKTGEDVAITYKCVTKWLNAKAGTKAASKANGKAAEEATAPKPTDPEEIAKVVLEAVSKERAGEKGKVKTNAQLVGLFTNKYTKLGFDAKKLAAAQKFVKDEEWTLGAVAELGGTYEEGVTVFA